MTTTTGDPSSLKTPSTLSGGDLVSRLLAATPPYLYNVPLTPHSFFFSEMLRSFVQAKAETSAASTLMPAPASRRRKRSWRDARDRPLELTTKDKRDHHNNPHTNHSEPHTERYFAPTATETRFKPDPPETETRPPSYEEKSILPEIIKPPDDTHTEFAKQARNFYDDSSRLFGADRSIQQETMFPPTSRLKPDEQINPHGDRKYDTDRQRSNQELSLVPETKSKLDFSPRNFVPSLTGRPDELSITPKNFLPSTVPNPEFLPNPLWYPPYPLPQSYPPIDPLHFFIDLRVSGHIWDRKLSERQAPFKSKHCSAFSVPQAKEYNNSPLNLTRSEASTSSKSEENFRGTHFILKNLMRTYKDIKEVETRLRERRGRDELVRISECIDDSSKDGSSSFLSPEEECHRNMEALIGLDLDYVKEPKKEPIHSPQIVE